MPPILEHTFTLRAFFDKKHMLDIKTVKGGPQRTIAPLNRGFMQGAGLEAELIPAGGDWLLINPDDNTVHLDVRLGLRVPATGHAIYVRYEGVLQIDAASHPQLSPASSARARSTAYGDHEWFATPIFECSDPDWKWLERGVFVAEGRWVVEEGEGEGEGGGGGGGKRGANKDVGIEYQIYRIRPSVK